MSQIEINTQADATYVWYPDRTHVYRIGHGIFGCAVELYEFNGETNMANKLKGSPRLTITKTIEEGVELARKRIETLNE